VKIVKIRNLFLKLLPVSLLILLISCGEITAKYDAVGDGKILPGDRVGTVNFSMTRTEIVALMGSPDSIFYGGDSFQLADYPVDAYFYYGYVPISIRFHNENMEEITVFNDYFVMDNGIKTGLTKTDIQSIAGIPDNETAGDNWEYLVNLKIMIEFRDGKSDQINVHK